MNKYSKQQSEYFDKKWFKKHYKLMSFLNNTPLIKYFWRKSLNITRKEKINYIEPNAVFYNYDGKEVTADFIGVNKYSRKIYNLAPVFWGLHIAIKQGVTWQSVFDAKWFEQFQAPLLTLLNGKAKWLFRKMMRVEKYDTQEDITYIHPNGIEFGNNGNEKQMHIFGYTKYAYKLHKWFYPVWATLHSLDSLFRLTKVNLNFGYDSFSLIPAAGANSPCDGHVGRHGVNESFSTLRAGAGTTNYESNSTEEIGLTSTATSDQYQKMTRLIFNFDTSIIGSANTLTAATLSLYAPSKGNALGSPDFHISGVSPATTDDIVNADYGTFATTSFASIAYASYTTSQYNVFTLNASGEANISKTSVSSFGGQLSWDILDDETGLTWSSSDASTLRSYMADNGSNEPRLTLTVTEIFVSAIGANSPCDGWVRRTLITESWTTIHDTADGNGTDVVGVNNLAQLSATTTTDVYNRLTRPISNFDTSSIGTGNSVTATSLNLYGNAVGDAMAQLVGVVSASPASDSTIANGDYDTFGTTRYATDIDLGSWSTSAYNTFTFNTTGKSAVDVTGVTNIGVLLSCDIDNAEPTWSSGASAYARWNAADTGSNEPLLSVTWTVPITATGFLSMF